MAIWVMKVYLGEDCGCSTVACSKCLQPALEPTHEEGFEDPYNKDRYFKWNHARTTSRSCLSQFCPHCGERMTGVDLDTKIYQKDYETQVKEINNETD